MTDTIFAPATPPGVSGVAVVRISGPKSLKSLQSLTGRTLVPRVADLRVLRSANGTKIDEALVLFFPGPASFTGEDVVELQCHGSLAILALIGKELAALGLRPAEAGEFARRAWRNGKLDLIGVEALDTLVHAKDEANLRLAQGQSGRKRQEIFQHWRTTLTNLMAGVEALIDFPEDDLPTELLEKNASALSALTADVEILLRNSEAAQVLDQGIDILLVGPPNVGKSTLLNAIAGYERAIVTPIAGTTRDFVEVEVSLGRFQVRFVDTAGLHDTEDEVESLGVSRTLARLDSAALVLSLFETGHTPAELQTVSEVWALRTKEFSAEVRSIAAGEPDIPGVQALLLDLEAWCEQQFGSVLEQVAFQKQRQVFHVKHMAQSLREAAFAPLSELQAEKLRQAAQAMAALEGRIDVEDVLDQLFAGFCIGK